MILYITSGFTYAAEYEYLILFQFRNPFGGVSSVVHSLSMSIINCLNGRFHVISHHPQDRRPQKCPRFAAFWGLITMLHKIAIQQFPEYVMRRDSHSRAFKQLGSAFDLKHQPESLLLQLLIFRLVEV